MAGSGGVDPFWELLFLVVFLLAAWIAGQVASMMKLPALAGEIIAGIILGPHVANIIAEPHTLILAGEVGLILLVVEAGLEVELAVLRQVGARGVLVGVLGSVGGPFMIGIGISKAFGLSMNAALAVGACLAPTSMGVALTVLKKAKVLNTPTGQLIVAAAVIDDVIALMLLGELQALSHPSPVNFAKPILAGVSFVIGIGSIAVYAIPPLLSRVILPLVPPQALELSVAVSLAAVVCGLMVALHYGGASHLLGAFLGGLCFCSLRSFQHLWHAQVKRLQSWLVRLFFAATVGFQIPARSLFKPRVLTMAAAFLLALVGKLATGFLVKPLTLKDGLTVGLAMSAWGEFAFVVAQAARFDLNLIDSDTHAAVMLAVLVSVLAAPAALRLTLGHFERGMNAPGGAIDEAMDAPLGVVYYHLELNCRTRWGLLPDILRTLAELNVHVVEFKVIPPRDQAPDCTGYEAYLKDGILFDEQPDTRHASGLQERLEEVRRVVMSQLTHDNTLELILEGEEPTGTLPRASIDASLPAAAAAAAARTEDVLLSDGDVSDGGVPGGRVGFARRSSARAAARLARTSSAASGNNTSPTSMTRSVSTSHIRSSSDGAGAGSGAAADAFDFAEKAPPAVAHPHTHAHAHKHVAIADADYDKGKLRRAKSASAAEWQRRKQAEAFKSELGEELQELQHPAAAGRRSFLRLERWMPGEEPAEWMEAGLVGRESSASLVMQREMESRHPNLSELMPRLSRSHSMLSTAMGQRGGAGYARVKKEDE